MIFFVIVQIAKTIPQELPKPLFYLLFLISLHSWLSKPFVLLVILVFLDYFLIKTFVLLVILVFFDCFPIKTLCFTCHSCLFWFGGTFGYCMFSF
jgi:hypothetical protein